MKILKEKIRFTQVSNDVLNDKNLSAKAKGVFAYLYSKPDDWDFAIERISNDFIDGDKSIRSWIKELESKNYLKRIKWWDWRMQYYIGINLDNTQPAKREGRENEPTSQNGNQPKCQPAETGGLSNIDNINNTEIINNKEINSHFEEFWNIYPKKVNKKKAEELFKKINKEGSVDLQKIISGLENYKKYIEVRKVDKSYILHASTFLNWRRWEDDFWIWEEKNFEKAWEKNYLEWL